MLPNSILGKLSVYDASALNHLLSTAIGCVARRFGRPRGREEGGKFE